MKRMTALGASILFLACVHCSFGIERIRVVAAENFYGDIMAQLGGSHVKVLSLMSDPNIDPHEYESDVSDAQAIAEANLIIANGGGYDDWIDKLLSASPSTKRTVIKGFDLSPTKLPENEHVWYDPGNVRVIADALARELKVMDPAHVLEYDQNLKAFQSGLARITLQFKTMRAAHANKPVALTETIFLYQTALIGLSVLTPFEFQKAVAEGTDPPVATVIVAENQIKSGKVKVLIFNRQTNTAITSKLITRAKAKGIPVLGVTETMPAGTHYQDWILNQLEELQKALEK